MNQLRCLLLVFAAAFGAVASFAQSHVILVQDSSPPGNVASLLLTVNESEWGVGSFTVTTLPLREGVNYFTVLGVVDFGPNCVGGAYGRLWQSETPLAVYSVLPGSPIVASIKASSLDATNRKRTRADAPYQIIYSAPNTTDYTFSLVRAIPSIANGFQPNTAFNSADVLPGYVYVPVSTMGRDITFSMSLNGVVSSYWYPLAPFASATNTEQVALLSTATNPPGQPTVAALDSMEVLPMPVATVSALPTEVTDIAAVGTIQVALSNLYPGHMTYAVVKSSTGEKWTSSPLYGVSNGTIAIPLSDVLSQMPRSGNTVTIEVWSENAIAGWAHALATGSSDASGKEQLLNPPVSFVVNVNGTIRLNISTL